jgi:hypothetical protein
MADNVTPACYTCGKDSLDSFDVQDASLHTLKPGFDIGEGKEWRPWSEHHPKSGRRRLGQHHRPKQYGVAD